MTVSLYFSKTGTGPIPLIIMHGLFGSHKNWASIAEELSDLCTVYAVDMRNHGDSPHTDTHTLADMSGDIRAFIEEHALDRPVLLGHSMGGFAAMHFALNHPEKISGLIVEDIAPKKYKKGHEAEFEALHLDLSGMKTRKEVDEAMKSAVADPAVRQFLQMSLDSTQPGGYRWKLNVAVLEESDFIEAFKAQAGESVYEGKCIFIAGGNSVYLKESDHEAVHTFFPDAEITTIPDADHWLHYSARNSFLKITKDFLSGLAPNQK